MNIIVDNFKIDRNGSNEFTVRIPYHGGRELRYAWMCWDEMLGLVARIGLGASFPLRHDTASDRIVETLSVIEVGAGYWTIICGDRFIDHLTFDEMLGFIAAYAAPNFRCRELFGGFKTYEQWAQCDAWMHRRNPKPAPKALIGVAT